MKLYTRTGDTGSTGLIGGARVPKDHLRIETYGSLDELNASLGLALASAPNNSPLIPLLTTLQNELFTLGSHLASPKDPPPNLSLPPISPAWPTRLEQEIDAAEAQLPPLTQFILPGGSEFASRLHLARTISRRAERLIITLHRAEPLDSTLLIYMNRLSDWLFAHARLANHLQGVPDVPWTK